MFDHFLILLSVILFSQFSLANEFVFKINYLHLQGESDQAAFPSTVVYKPGSQLSLGYTLHFYKNNSIGLVANYSILKPEATNANLFVDQEKYDDLEGQAFYSYLFKSGIRLKLLGGVKSFPIYEIDGVSLTFSDFVPTFYGLGLAFVTANKLGVLRTEYIYKHISKTSTVDEEWQGYDQSISIDYNFKWNKFATGIYFKYGFSNLTSELENEFQTDLRSFGLYYKLKLN